MTTPGYGPVPFQNESATNFVTQVPQEVLYATLLNHLQGAFGTESQIDLVLPVKAGQTITNGRVVSIDPVTNSFQLGLGSTKGPAYFSKPAGGYPGVPAAGNVYGDGILALPCLAPYRLGTTEFVAGSYPANTPLTCNSVGQLTAGVPYEDPIVGWTARGVLTNYDKPGRSLLEFFTDWLPSFGGASSYLR